MIKNDVGFNYVLSNSVSFGLSFVEYKVGCFKNGVSLFQTNYFRCTFFLVFDVHVCFLFIYTIFISILCVSRRELSLIESNQQICDFNEWLFFLKAKTLHCGTYNRSVYSWHITGQGFRYWGDGDFKNFLTAMHNIIK